MACQPDNTITHKRGDGFDVALQLPANYWDGFFVGWALKAQVRSAADALVAELDCEWGDPLTTRVIRARKADTADWPIAPLYFDVQLSKTGELTQSTETVTVYCQKDATHA